MLNTIIGTQITLSVFLICTGVSLALGLCAALLCMYKSSYTQSFVLTLAMLPAIVQVVIMLVNGNIGAGVAVYAVLVIALRILRAEDVRSIPKGEKIIKLLHLK